MTFRSADLDELYDLLSTARAVVAMHDIHNGARDTDVIGLRHDVDDNAGSLETAVKIAGWETERGFRSTYFILHTASYWHDEPRLRSALEEIAGHGHEIGIHTNAITEAIHTGRDPHDILQDAIGQLRGYGHPVYGVAGHGDELCRRVGFVNDEIFTECARPEMGDPARTLIYGNQHLTLDPMPLADYELVYETYRLPHRRYLSDSGGAWNEPPASMLHGPGQLHILQHPDWWALAFDEETHHGAS